MLFAHSATAHAPAQPYSEHVRAVTEQSKAKLGQMFAYYSGAVNRAAVFYALELAATYHDLGKVMPECQRILSGQAPPGTRMVNHVDAGSALLLGMYRATRNPLYLIAATLIDGHHIGLLNGGERGWETYSQVRQNDFLRDLRPLSTFGINSNASVREYVDATLQSIVAAHNQECGLLPIRQTGILRLEDVPALMIRFMMSALSDADHSDTARSGGWPTVSPYQKPSYLQPRERLESLKAYVGKLRGGKELRKRRNLLRTATFNDCLALDPSHRIYLLETPVGSGKTASSLAAALSLASEHGLRRVFHISPFVNIVSQTAEVMRQALRVNGDPQTDYVVAEHQHTREYHDQRAKVHAVEWDTPLVCTTAVQFLSSCFSNKPVALKKLHNVPGSVLIFDEYEAMMPYELWQIFSILISQLVEQWGCRVIFCSGTPAHVWDIPNLRCSSIKPTCSIIRPETSASWKRIEKRRVEASVQESPMDGQGFIQHLRRFKGSKLIICNTLRNAALLGHGLNMTEPRGTVYHLSNALTVRDRMTKLNEIKARLRSKEPIIVVSTSMIEAGVDLSFRHGFGELRDQRAASQGKGRVNREGEYRASQWQTFTLAPSLNFPFTSNPGFGDAIDIFLSRLEEGSDFDENDYTEAVKKLTRRQNIAHVMNLIRDAEESKRFRMVRDLVRVIDDWQVPVLASSELFRRLAIGAVGAEEGLGSVRDIWKALTQDSFTLMGAPLAKGRYSVLSLERCVGDAYYKDELLSRVEPRNVLLWDGGYDHFLGYMNEVLVRLGVEGVVRGHNPAEAIRRDAAAMGIEIREIDPAQDIDHD